MTRRRTIANPTGLNQPTYYRLAITNPMGDTMYHNQPFANREIAEAASQEMRFRIAKNTRHALGWSVRVVTVTSR